MDPNNKDTGQAKQPKGKLVAEPTVVPVQPIKTQDTVTKQVPGPNGLSTGVSPNSKIKSRPKKSIRKVPSLSVNDMGHRPGSGHDGCGRLPDTHKYEKKRKMSIKNKKSKSKKKLSKRALEIEANILLLQQQIEEEMAKEKAMTTDEIACLIAPEDYPHIYRPPDTNTTKTVKAVKSGVLRMPQDTPTALVAPEEYIHVYDNGKKNKKEYNFNVNKTKAKSTVGRVPADPVKVLIDYDDDQDRYHKQTTDDKTGETGAKTRVPVNEPCAALAPEVYVRLYNNEKQIDQVKKAQKQKSK